ncbi:hypothetical protein H5410_062348 [Solanum commersonii]|uniref:Uncharacterized protein n=1 Tax=Solanum commersonii TaxID=4109 RepID=A0A9J5WCD8_SOLCO|nr:hypothetical protein H5410_062348 [Solanum commersonii]
MTLKFWITKKSMDYSTRKSAKWGVCLLRGSFDLENRPVWLSGPTVSIAKGSFDLKNGQVWTSRPIGSISKVLTDIHEYFWQKLHQNSKSPKYPWTIAHENRQNKGLSCFGARLTLKMGRFGRLVQPAP